MADGNIFDDELTARVQQIVRQYLNSYQPRPKRLRRPQPAGGGAESAGTLAAGFGLVTQAPVPGHHIGEPDGRYLPLTLSWKPYRTDGSEMTIDYDNPAWPNDPDVTANSLDFFGGHQYFSCPVGSVVLLLKFVFGNESITIGLVTDCNWLLSQLGGYAPETALVAAGTAPGMFWAGGSCDTGTP